MITEFRTFLSSLTGISTIEIIDDKSLSFKYENLTFLFVSEESSYIRLLLPKIAQVTEENRTRIYEQMNRTNQEYKVAKMFIHDNYVWVSIDQFVYSKERVSELFMTAIKILEAATSEFRGNVNDK